LFDQRQLRQVYPKAMISTEKTNLLHIKQGETKMNEKARISAFKTLAILVVLAVLLFAGIGITSVAAQSSIPGDALYPVKTTIEQTRLGLAQDAGNRAQMRMSFAEQRLEEISQLIKEGRYREISPAVLAFETDINNAILELETVAKGDPARAARLALDITSALTRYGQTLTTMAAAAPDSVKSEVFRALDTTQIAGSLEMPSGDDNGNDNINNNDNGNDQVNDNANLNNNDNSDDRSNDNANLNNNDNADDQSNDNANLNNNDNGDDQGNDNANLNNNDNADDQGNDNANLNNNDNGDDQGNDNANLNNNDNTDDHSNDNANINNNPNDDSGGGNSGGNDSNTNDDSGSGKDSGNDNSSKDDHKGKGG
jgi:hypothetical protein